MRKKLSCACWILLSLLLLAGCGESSNQNKNQSKVDNNPATAISKNQATTYNGWTTVKIESDVEFQIPPTLELRTNDFQNLLDDNSLEIAKDVYKFTNKNLVKQIVAQPKGANNLEPSALEHFASVKFRIEKFSNTLPKWGDDVKFTSKYLAKSDKERIEQIYSYYKTIPEFKSFNVYVIKPSRILAISGTKCIYGQMGMKWEGQEELVLDSYLFFNGDRIYTFTISIASNDYEYWTTNDNNLRNIVNTVKPCKS